MQYVWQHRLWPGGAMATTAGQPVEVVDPGLLNRDAGPDFFNAKVRIGDRLWVGNVELHLRASDWNRHGHSADPAYHTVILHVVGADDAVIARPDGTPIPQLVMACSDEFLGRYRDLVQNPASELACAPALGDVPSVYVADWLTALSLERLQAKAARVAALAAAESGDWQHAVYVTLARTMGFSKNNDAFERLALSMPLRRLRKHADNPLSVEAMLLGQAGFLDDLPPDIAADPYVQRLVMEYRFMSAKFSLAKPRDLGWKTGRMRPGNFPVRRVATLARFVCLDFSAGQKMLATATVDQARSIFDIDLAGYWARRCNFGPENTASSKAFSRSSVDVLIINVLVPVLYAYGLVYGNDDVMARAVGLLQQLPAEANTVTRLFAAAGISCRDAFASQALIQLRRAYCEHRKCLYCRFGHRLLARRNSGSAVFVSLPQNSPNQ